MLSKAQEKLIKTLHTKKGRQKSGLCLVEGKKVIETAGNAVNYTFGPEDSDIYHRLVTTETPQAIAGVAKIPQFSESDAEQMPTMVVLDGVQDPGNVGAILRLCLGFNASLLLIDSVDVTNAKVIRSSAGAMFRVPWITMSRKRAEEYIQSLNRPVYRLEKTDESQPVDTLLSENNIFIAGSEGQGIQMEINAPSLYIPHSEKLESLNVGHALAIILQKTYRNY